MTTLCFLCFRSNKINIESRKKDHDVLNQRYHGELPKGHYITEHIMEEKKEVINEKCFSLDFLQIFCCKPSKHLSFSD